MASPEFLSTLNEEQCKKAVIALTEWSAAQKAKKEETQLIVKDEYLFLVVAMKMMAAEAKRKAYTIALPYPLHDPREASILLLVKDPQREYKDLMEKAGVNFVTRVVGVNKLKGKFKTFEARRALLAEHDIVLADDRILRMMPKLLGKDGWKRNPIPVNISSPKSVKKNLEKAINSTYMQPSKGTCVTIKIARTTAPAAQSSTNLIAAIPQMVSHIKGGWSNILNMHVKTCKSTALPIWHCNPSTRFDLPEDFSRPKKAVNEDTDSEPDAPENIQIKKAISKGVDFVKNTVAKVAEGYSSLTSGKSANEDSSLRKKRKAADTEESPAVVKSAVSKKPNSGKKSKEDVELSDVSVNQKETKKSDKSSKGGKIAETVKPDKVEMIRKEASKSKNTLLEKTRVTPSASAKKSVKEDLRKSSTRPSIKKEMIKKIKGSSRK